MVELMDRQSIPGSLSRHPDQLNLVISWERLLARNHREARCRYGIARASWGGGALSTLPMLFVVGVFTLRGGCCGRGYG